MNDANSIEDVDIDFCYLYHDIVSNEERVEFHVDYRNQITRDQQQQEQLEMHSFFKEKKPSISIRVSSQAKPLMIFGQDKRRVRSISSWFQDVGWTERPMPAAAEG